MRAFQSVFALAFSSVLFAACASAPSGSESTGDTAQAQTVAACQSDSDCKHGDVCEPICPVIPNQPHCNVAGGSCEVACTRTAVSLSGSTFASADGAHSVTFTSATKFTKTDGCPKTGIHCTAIAYEQGTYSSNGTKITLSPTVGVRDTLSVESHCYEGLVDSADGVELYPVAATGN